MKKSLICGVGKVDLDYQKEITEKQGDKYVLVWRCPFYTRWKSMLVRCYSEKTYRTYEDCQVCDEWLLFSNFKAWMENQDWQGKALDKDLLKEGNKIYCPEYCRFVPPVVNTFMIHYTHSNNGLPIGVHWCKRAEAYISRCRNPLTGKRKNLGQFDCVYAAGNAWKKEKLKMLELLKDEGYLEDKEVFLSIKTRLSKMYVEDL